MVDCSHQETSRITGCMLSLALFVQLISLGLKPGLAWQNSHPQGNSNTRDITQQDHPSVLKAASLQTASQEVVEEL